MQGSSLPMWVAILILGVMIALVSGVFLPYVSKEDKKKAEAFLYSTRKEEVPTITIESRPFSAWIIFILLALVLAAAILYCKTSFLAAAAAIGLGIVGEILLMIAVFFAVAVCFSGFILLFVFAAYITGEDLGKYYRRHYGVNVKILSED